ncbi:MAG: DUF368 domain-containing protein [Clostridia bacterium]|nr:DUF368 domain-containing protein [Clostridia bacterium]
MKEPIRAVSGGIAVGIANVIPGVSGGTMMAIMNIFDRTMNAISDITKKDNDHRVKDIVFLLEVVLGAVIGILGFSRLLEWLFGVVPMPTVFWFVGLVALSVPVFIKGQMKDAPVHAGAIAAGAAIVAALTVAKVIWFPEEAAEIDPVTGEAIKIAYDLPAFSLVNCGLLTVAGLVAGFAMLLPGVSGSLVLMILGLYEFVWFNYVNNVSTLLKDLSVDNIIKFIPAGFFAIGVVLGVVLSAKITAVAMKKNARLTLNFLLGLVGASAVSIVFINLDKLTGDVWMILGSVVAFALGGAIVLGLGKVTAE